MFISPPLLAATFTVNSTSDAVDANPGDGVCRTSSATCTLRAAVMEANALAGPDEIVLSATTYTLSITGSGENAARTGDLDITGATGNNLIIRGPAGAASTTRITAGGSFSGGIDRVFHFLGRNNVTISDVSIQSGAVSGQNGGGINNQTAWVTLKNCQITGNSTSWSDSSKSGGQGGGVYNASSGRMTIDNCIFRSNQANTSTSASENAFNGGGAIYNSGQMTVSNSIIETNTTSRFGAGVHNFGGDLSITSSIIRSNTGPAIDASGFGGASGAGGGGGVANFGGQVTLRDSWVNQNRSMEGGGIYNFPGGPLSARMIIVSSAISANSADMWGGGISNWDRLSVIYTAITNNVVGASGGQFGFSGAFMGEGGGISNMALGDALVQHSTISGNTVARAGGGIYNGARVKLVHVTLRNNKAANGRLCTSGGSGGGGGFGGGFGGGSFTNFTNCSGSYVFGNEVFNSNASNSTNKEIIFERTIIGGGASPAGNCLAGDADTDGFAAAMVKVVPFKATSNGYNIDSGNTCALTGATDRINTDPQLAALSDFGQGATLPGGARVPQSIHTPNPGSPAINAIPNASCPKPGIDQRLYIRPDPTSGSCDIGAVENSTVKASLADLGLAISSFSSTVTGPTTRAVVGAEIRYDITLKNNGPDEAKGLITITQSFDGDVVFAGGFSDDPSITCGQSSGTTITCSKTNGLAKDEAVEIALNVKPVIGDKRTLNTTVSVSAADASVIDHVVDNDSVSLSRSLSSGDPVVNADAGNVNSGGAGAFGPGALAALLAFGLWRGSRRRLRG
ncbi:MAG: CSLREA domain-containing protein [Gammaproteobacteria bacterium]|nr:CSLREA domain-containing protein [Gammaproteobacteria bacterium]